MTKPTPRPWVYRQIGTDSLILSSPDALAEDSIAMVFGTMGTGAEYRANQEANAAHIVHCVNSHDRLVEALQATSFIAKTYHSEKKVELAEADETCKKHGLESVSIAAKRALHTMEGALKMADDVLQEVAALNATKDLI